MKKRSSYLSVLFLTALFLLINRTYAQTLTPGVVAASQTVCLGSPITPFTSVLPASGGTGPISYMWEITTDTTTGFSPAGVTTETLNPFNYGTITYYLRRSASTSADGTVYSNIITVYRPSRPNISITTSAMDACPGQPYTFSVSSTSGASYSWSGPNGFASSATSFTITNPQSFHQGNYTCIVTGTSGCTNSGSKFLYLLDYYSITPVFKCLGTPALLQVQNTNLATYTWAGPSGFTGSGAIVNIYSVNNLSAGIYTITGQFNNSCSVVRYINLSARPQPTVEILPTPAVICSGDNVPIVYFQLSGATNYYWMGSQALLQNPQIGLTPSVTTLYTVIGEDTYGCKDTTQTMIFVSECTGLAEQGLQAQEISIYPNPSNGEFRINAPGKTSLRIINAMGQLIDTIELNNENNFTYDTTHYAAGIYYIVPEEPSQRNTIRKFLVYK